MPSSSWLVRLPAYSCYNCTARGEILNGYTCDSSGTVKRIDRIFRRLRASVQAHTYGTPSRAMMSIFVSDLMVSTISFSTLFGLSASSTIGARCPRSSCALAHCSIIQLDACSPTLSNQSGFPDTTSICLTICLWEMLQFCASDALILCSQ